MGSWKMDVLPWELPYQWRFERNIISKCGHVHVMNTHVALQGFATNIP